MGLGLGYSGSGIGSIAFIASSVKSCDIRSIWHPIQTHLAKPY
jgi:hypothetical protein